MIDLSEDDIKDLLSCIHLANNEGIYRGRSELKENLEKALLDPDIKKPWWEKQYVKDKILEIVNDSWKWDRK